MRKLAATTTAALLVVASPLLMGAAAVPAAADTGCVPAEAWTETIVITPEVPAVPAIPAVPEVPEISHMETQVVKEAWTETVVDQEAWDAEVFDHWQRYSWTGGPHLSDDPPAFPSADWQPNVQGDPHGVGVEGAYFRSHGNEGNGDWFYLEAVTHIEHHEAITHTVEHPAVTVEVKVIDQEYVPGTPGVPGTPAIPAVTEEVTHPAVVCPVPEKAAATQQQDAKPTSLALTGGEAALPLALGGAGAVGLGLTLTGIRRFAKN